MKLFNLIVLCSLVLVYSSKAQTISANWKTDLSTAVEAFKKCNGTIENNVNPCSKYTGESINKVYQVNDFYSDELKRYLTGTEIASNIGSNTNWKKLGIGLSQEALNEAQNAANSNKAVVAVYTDDNGLSHVALILPGKLSPSGSWGRNVPNSASFFMNSPQRSYSEKALSYAFSKTMIKDLIIYSRNY